MAKKKPKQKVRGRRKIARGRPRREIVEVEIANEKPRREIVGVDIAGGKHRSPRILRQLSARGVKRGGGIAGGNPTGMSWSSVKIDNTAYTWGTGVALPGGSRHEVEGESEIVEKKTRREARRGRAEKKPRVEREREISEEKPTSEVEKEREIERKRLALFKKWAVVPIPLSETTEAEEKPTSEVGRGPEIAREKPRREVKGKRKIAKEKPKREVKRERGIVEKKPRREAKRVRAEKRPRIKRKREISEERIMPTVVEEKITPAVVEEKPKLELKKEREIAEEKITPVVTEEKIMPAVVEEKIMPAIVEEKITPAVVEEKLKIMPTGIVTLDGAMGGGFPSGSLVLLMGEIGSGYNEFAMTSSVMLAATKAGRLSRPPGENIVLPEEIWWVTFTRKQSDLISEMAPSFDSDLYELFSKQANFKDLSEAYFATSSVPLEWVSKKPVDKGGEGEMLATVGKMLAGVYNLADRPSSKPKGLLNSLANFLTERAPNNVVILNTLTDLAMLYSESEADWYEFMIFLRGLQRATKEWGGLIYASLDANLLGKHREQEIAACVDGVLTFEWVQAGPAERGRTLYIKKFRRLPSSAVGASMRFNVNLTSSVGLQVTKPELIEGLKA